MTTTTIETSSRASQTEEDARRTRLNNARRLVRELIEEDPEFAAMIAAAASSDASDEADPELLEFRASSKAVGEPGRSAAARLRETFLKRNR